MKWGKIMVVHYEIMDDVQFCVLTFTQTFTHAYIHTYVYIPTNRLIALLLLDQYMTINVFTEHCEAFNLRNRKRFPENELKIN